MSCKLRAALYIRVSTEEQALEGQSVAAQLEVLTNYCRLYSIDIYSTYKDLGVSGKETKNRPGLINMLQDARQGKFNMVLVWKISRLSRSLKDLLFIIDYLEGLQVSFSSYSEKFDTSTPVGKMTLQLLGSIAEFERNTIIDNVKLGLQEYARKGGKTGTVLGYDNIEKQLVINPQEAEIVKLIYKLYTAKRMSMADIAAYLNKHGYKTKRSNSFRKDSIAVILSNPVYIGINRHKIGSSDEYQVKGSHLPIIAAEVWEHAQKLRQNNKYTRPVKDNNSLEFLLSGKLRCPLCNSAMYGTLTRSNGKGYKYYRCRACSCTRKFEETEQHILEQLKPQLIRQWTARNHNEEAEQLIYKPKYFNTRIDHQREIKAAYKLLDRYVSLLCQEEYSNSIVLQERIKELEARISRLKENLSAIASEVSDKEASRNYVEQAEVVSEYNERAAIKRMIEALIEAIYITPDNSIFDISWSCCLSKEHELL